MLAREPTIKVVGPGFFPEASNNNNKGKILKRGPIH
jgi:hypothetical protein